MGGGESAQYTEAEVATLRASVVGSAPPICPRCPGGVVMRRRSIGGGSFGLGYARSREWLLCPECRRSAIFDQGRGTRT
jgi:hypothetical protein